MHSLIEPLESRQLLSAGPTVTGFRISNRHPTTSTGTLVITVTYSDPDGVDPTSISDHNIRVAEPGGFARYARAISSQSNGDGTVRTVIYKLPPPGGTWDHFDDGVYAFTLHGGTVFDTQGNPANFTKLGSIRVAIPTT